MKLNVALPARDSGSDGTIFLLLKFKPGIEIFIHEIQMPESIQDAETPSRPSVSRRAHAMKRPRLEKNGQMTFFACYLPLCHLALRASVYDAWITTKTPE
ncbi:hypothetical protein [Pseudomonas jessenii]|uniref:hypothetical protein n=1 Tax=Pseudomonas jessenii TaxID=77298 RepID=UPI0015F017B3|nr:hypothetical protein [Pseudomonas jessenii]